MNFSTIIVTGIMIITPITQYQTIKPIAYEWCKSVIGSVKMDNDRFTQFNKDYGSVIGEIKPHTDESIDKATWMCEIFAPNSTTMEDIINSSSGAIEGIQVNLETIPTPQ